MPSVSGQSNSHFRASAPPKRLCGMLFVNAHKCALVAMTAARTMSYGFLLPTPPVLPKILQPGIGPCFVKQSISRSPPSACREHPQSDTYCRAERGQPTAESRGSDTGCGVTMNCRVSTTDGGGPSGGLLTVNNLVWIVERRISVERRRSTAGGEYGSSSVGSLPDPEPPESDPPYQTTRWPHHKQPQSQCPAPSSPALLRPKPDNQ